MTGGGATHGFLTPTREHPAHSGSGNTPSSSARHLHQHTSHRIVSHTHKDTPGSGHAKKLGTPLGVTNGSPMSHYGSPRGDIYIPDREEDDYVVVNDRIVMYEFPFHTAFVNNIIQVDLTYIDYNDDNVDKFCPDFMMDLMFVPDGSDDNASTTKEELLSAVAEDPVSGHAPGSDEDVNWMRTFGLPLTRRADAHPLTYLVLNHVVAPQSRYVKCPLKGPLIIL